MSPKLTWSIPLLVVSILLVFQNCAPTMSNTDLSSTDGTVDLQSTHQDRDHDTSGLTEPEKIESRSRDLVSDRVLILRQLQSVFGPTTVSLDQDKISTDLRTFGSPCSPYEAYRYARGTNFALGDATRACAFTSSAGGMNAPVLPEVNTIRQGIMQHYCQVLSSNAKSLAYALAQVKSGGAPEGSKENVLKAFRLFYRSAPQPSDTVLQSLQVLLPGATVTAEDWTPIFYTLCVSSGWQVL